MVAVLLSGNTSSIQLFKLNADDRHAAIISLVIYFFFIFLIVYVLIRIVNLDRRRMRVRLNILRMNLYFRSMLSVNRNLFFLTIINIVTGHINAQIS